jgi:hypothetical protein
MCLIICPLSSCFFKWAWWLEQPSKSLRFKLLGWLNESNWPQLWCWNASYNLHAVYKSPCQGQLLTISCYHQGGSQKIAQSYTSLILTWWISKTERLCMCVCMRTWDACFDQIGVGGTYRINATTFIIEEYLTIIYLNLQHTRWATTMPQKNINSTCNMLFMQNASRWYHWEKTYLTALRHPPSWPHVCKTHLLQCANVLHWHCAK